MSKSNFQDSPLSATSAEQAKLQLVQSQFGAAAADYVTSKVHASGRDLAWLPEAASLTGVERVLDVATGGGHAAFALAPGAAEVVALDLTRPMLEVAHKEALARHLTNIHYLEGDAHAIPCADQSFDVVVCRKAAHHFPAIHQAIKEWARVLKPAGKLLLVDSVSPEEAEIDAFLHEIEVLRDPSHERNYRISEWHAFLSEADFEILSTREWGIVLEVADWTQRMRTPPAVVAVIEQNLREASPAVRDRLYIEDSDGTLAFTLPTAFIVATRKV